MAGAATLRCKVERDLREHAYLVQRAAKITFVVIFILSPLKV